MTTISSRYFVMSVFFCLFAGCKSLEQQIEEQRQTGVKELHSFLGIELGDSFPGKSDIISYTNKWNDNRMAFVSNRKFVNAPEFFNTVLLTPDGRVYEIISFASFYTAELRSSDDKSQHSNPAYKTVGYAKHRGDKITFSADTHQSRPLVGIQVASSICAKERAKLYSTLEKKYQKELIKIDYFDSIIPFQNERKIIITDNGCSLILKAVDERLKRETDEAKMKSESQNVGLNAL